MNGVSAWLSGYGLCAYASSRACAAAMPSIQATGETPPVDRARRGDAAGDERVGLTVWIAAYAGLSSGCT